MSGTTERLLGYHVKKDFDVQLTEWKNIGPHQAVVRFVEFLCCLCGPQSTCPTPVGERSIFDATAVQKAEVRKTAHRVLQAFYQKTTKLDSSELKLFLDAIIKEDHVKNTAGEKCLPMVTEVGKEMYSWFIHSDGSQWVSALTHFVPTDALPTCSGMPPMMCGVAPAMTASFPPVPALNVDSRVQIVNGWKRLIDLVQDMVHVAHRSEQKRKELIPVVSLLLQTYLVETGKKIPEAPSTATAASHSVEGLLRFVAGLVS